VYLQFRCNSRDDVTFSCESYVNNIQKCSSRVAETTLPLHYEDEPVDGLQGNKQHLFWVIRNINNRSIREIGCIWISEEVICSDQNKQDPWPESASELYRPSYRRLSTKLMPTFEDRGGVAYSARRIPYGRNPAFLDRSPYHFFQVALQLYSRSLSGPCSRPTTSQKIW
jgi:hypothetical protein